MRTRPLCESSAEEATEAEAQSAIGVRGRGGRISALARGSLEWAQTPRVAVSHRTPPGPEGSKGRRALPGARGVLSCSERARCQAVRIRREPPPCTAATGRRPSPRSSARSTSPSRCMQALRTGRVNHAYLFCGPRGCGKTTSARILARCLNCEQGPDRRPRAACATPASALARGGPGIDRRHRDRRGQPRRRRRRPRPARAGVLRAGRAAATRSTSSTRRTWSRTQGFNALLKLVEEPPRAREVRLRDDRAGEGHRHDPVAHPPLPVPADPAARAARPTCSELCERGGRRGRAGACCRSSSAPAAARSATRCRVLDQLHRRRRARGRHLRARGRRCSASPTASCSTRSSTRSPPATAPRCSAPSTR